MLYAGKKNDLTYVTRGVDKRCSSLAYSCTVYKKGIFCDVVIIEESRKNEFNFDTVNAVILVNYGNKLKMEVVSKSKGTILEGFVPVRYNNEFRELVDKLREEEHCTDSLFMREHSIASYIFIFEKGKKLIAMLNRMGVRIKGTLLQ